MIKLGKAYNNNKKLLETLLLGDLRTFYKLGNPHLISCMSHVLCLNIIEALL